MPRVKRHRRKTHKLSEGELFKKTSANILHTIKSDLFIPASPPKKLCDFITPPHNQRVVNLTPETNRNSPAHFVPRVDSERCGNVLLHHSRKGLRHSGMSAWDSSMGTVSWVCCLILATAAKVFFIVWVCDFHFHHVVLEIIHDQQRERDYFVYTKSHWQPACSMEHTYI